MIVIVIFIATISSFISNSISMYKTVTHCHRNPAEKEIQVFLSTYYEEQD